MSELPSGWALSTIGETCEVIQGQSPPGGSYNTEGIGLPFFQGKAEFGDLYPSIRKWTTDPKKIAEEGDALLSIRAPVGPTNLAPIRCVIGRGLAAIRPMAGISARFVLYWLRSSESLLAAGATGSTFEAVSGSQVREHQLPLPPLNEQRRIVAAIEEHLSRLDAASASLAAAARRLDLSRGQFVENTMRGEWPSTTLGEIAEISGGVTKDAKRQADPAFVEVPYLRVANVQRGFLDLRKVTTIRVPAQKAAALRLEVGDVLFNEGGDRDKLGRGWVWSGEIKDCIHQNHVFRARLQDGFDPKFVSWHGNTFGRDWFERHGRQTTNLASLNLTTLRAFPVPAPPLGEQRQIVAEVEARLSVLDTLRGAIERAQRRSASLRRAVLERAFRGELVPQDPSDEPASVLLERIRAERAATPAQPRRRRVGA